tara:strand:+ start:750 stop:950 length:201 start_codon:yes stop_codon:yes gene_type:complete
MLFMNLASVMLGVIGPWQIVLIVAVVLLLFGGRKIPELMRGLGGGVKEFKNAIKEDDKEPSSSDKK